MDVCASNFSSSELANLFNDFGTFGSAGQLPSDSNPSAASSDASSSSLDASQTAALTAQLTQLLGNASVVVGTSAIPSPTALLEPAFFAQSAPAGLDGSSGGGLFPQPSRTVTASSADAQGSSPLYYVTTDCETLGTLDVQILNQLSCAMDRGLQVMRGERWSVLLLSNTPDLLGKNSPRQPMTPAR